MNTIELNDVCEQKISRDLRIDFARGGVLLYLVLHHIDSNWTITRVFDVFGFSDAAEVFVFLSGYVCGLSYSRYLRGKGFVACQCKAIRRSAQLYLAHTFTMIGYLVCLSGLRWALCFLGDGDSFEHSIAYPEAFFELVRRSLCLECPLRMFDILPLYLLLLLFLPMFLWLFERGHFVAFLVAITIYTVGLTWNARIGRMPFDTLLHYNPLGWQFLFYMTAFIGADRTIKKLCLPDNVSALVLSLAIIEAAFIALMLLPRHSILWIGKRYCEPFRLIHFFAIATIGNALLLRSPKVWESRLAVPVVVCGQNSLIVYCIGGIYSNIANTILPLVGYDNWSLLTANLGGIFCCVISACFWKKSKQWATVPTF